MGWYADGSAVELVVCTVRWHAFMFLSYRLLRGSMILIVWLTASCLWQSAWRRDKLLGLLLGITANSCWVVPQAWCEFCCRSTFSIHLSKIAINSSPSFDKPTDISPHERWSRASHHASKSLRVVVRWQALALKLIELLLSSQNDSFLTSRVSNCSCALVCWVSLCGTAAIVLLSKGSWAADGSLGSRHCWCLADCPDRLSPTILIVSCTNQLRLAKV